MTSLMVNVVNLQSWIPAIVELFKERIHEQQQQLYILLTADLPPLTTDAAVLQQVLIELLTYACQQASMGELITVSACAIQDTIQISIGHSGIEIATRDQSRLFDSLCYVPQTDSQPHNGNGLMRAQSLAKQLGTSIQLENAPNQTMLTLQFPYKVLSNDRQPNHESERIILLSGTTTKPLTDCLS